MTRNGGGVILGVVLDGLVGGRVVTRANRIAEMDRGHQEEGRAGAIQRRAGEVEALRENLCDQARLRRRARRFQRRGRGFGQWPGGTSAELLGAKTPRNNFFSRFSRFSPTLENMVGTLEGGQ